MDLLDTLMIAGVGLAVVFCGLLIWTQLRGGRQNRREEDPIRRGERTDLYMLLVWSAMVLTQVGNIIRHVQEGLASHVSAVGWWAVAGDLVICGVFAGRLLLRHEMRVYEAKRGRVFISGN